MTRRRPSPVRTPKANTGRPQAATERLPKKRGPALVPAGSFGRLLLPACSIAGLLWYLFPGTGFDLGELLRCLAGLIALWAPIGAVVFLLLDGQLDDLLSRLTFSAIASFTLTTLAYFAFCVAGLWLPGFEKAFYAAQAGLLLLALVWAWRRGLRPALGRLRVAAERFDWVLAALIVASLLVTLRYKTAFEWQSQEHNHLLVANGDQTYFAAIAHELGRHTPALQQPTRAGVPDRAYHMFPHLTTMLIARYTGQPDMLRANMVYQYSLFDLLTGLALFCTVWLLTGSRAAGYLTVILMYIGAVPLPPLGHDQVEEFFYFNLWPHATSTLEPALITSPQMYSGIVVYYGIFLGLVLACQRVWRGQSVGSLLVVTALMVGTMARVRIQIFLPLLPGFLLLLAFFWWKGRKPIVLAAGCLSLAVATGLLLETRLGIYLPNTSHLTFGNSQLPWKFDFLRSWPGAPLIWEQLSTNLYAYPQTRDWIWQIVCILLFTLANIIGLPLLVGCMAYFRQGWAWGEWRPLSLLVLWLVLTSLLGASCLAATYDSWSVGGQMLLHASWYLFPLAGAGLWVLWHYLPSAWQQPRHVWQAIGVALVLGTCLWQMVRPPSRLEQDQRDKQIALSEDEWAGLEYIRQALPAEAVVLFPNYKGPGLALVSGIAGRRVYLEYVPVSAKLWKDEADSDTNRLLRMGRLYTASGEEEFRRAIPPEVTHLFEYARQPFLVHPANVLKAAWRSPQHKVTIWEVLR